MRFINLTPHTLNVVDSDDQPVMDIDPSGDVARVDVSRTQVDTVDGVPVYDSTFGDVTGLPAPADDAIYVVSGKVLSAVDRDDVVAPGDLVRDSDGNIIGCRGFTR